MLRIKVDYAFFCDLVRQENTGKFIFIGVYTNALVTHKYPLNLSLTFFAHGRHIGTGKAPVSFRVMYMPGDIEVFSMDTVAVIEQSEGEEGNFDVAIAFDFQVQRDGYLSLQLSQQQDTWDELARLPVRQSGS